MSFFKKSSSPPNVLSPLAFVRSGNRITLATMDSDNDIIIEQIDHPDTLQALLKKWELDFGYTFAPTDTQYLTVVGESNEYSRVLPLSDKIPIDQEQLAEYLIQSARSGETGQDGQPLFEHSLQTHASTLSVSTGGVPVLTSVPRDAVGNALLNLFDADDVLSIGNLSLSLAIETPARAVARSVLSKMRLLPDVRELVVFLIFGQTGHSLAFWERSRGLFYESAVGVNLLDNNGPDAFDEFIIPENEKDLFPEENSQEDAIQFAVDRVRKLAGPDAVREMGLVLNQIVIACPPENAGSLKKELEDFATWHKIPLQIFSRDEEIVTGLMISLHESEINDLCNPINLAYDLLAQAEQRATLEEIKSEQLVFKRRSKIKYALILPIIALLGISLGLVFNELRTKMSLASKNAKLTAEKERLQPITAARKSYEGNLTWYNDYLSQLVGLRQRQGIALQLFNDLNERYPLAFDSSFNICELKLAANGQLDIRGLSHEEQAFTAFVRSLETSEPIPNSDVRLFTNLAPEFGQSSKTASNVALPASSTITANLPPGVVGWKISAVYSPVARLKPLVAPPPMPGTNPAVPGTSNQPVLPNANSNSNPANASGGK